MNIENEHLFNNALSTGINLFVGAGFSILAKDEDGNRLPLGSELSKELAAMYGCHTRPQWQQSSGFRCI